MADADEGRRADAVCDGGDLDCGSGLLLIIREAMAPLRPGGILEVRSREPSVREDLPAWCRMVGHPLLAIEDGGAGTTCYLVRKKGADHELARDLEEAQRFVWRVRVNWNQGMRARAYARNHSFEVGQPASFDTADAAVSALEYLLGAVGGALAVGFQWRLSRAGVQVQALEIALEASCHDVLHFLGIQETGEPGLDELRMKVYLSSDAEPARVESIWQDTLKRCPLAGSLARRVPITADLRSL